jgi:hypothetical protein
MTRREEAYRYLNLIRNADKRRYGFAYLAWMRNHAIGHEPERGRLSYMAAQAVRMQLHEILGPAPMAEMNEEA